MTEQATTGGRAKVGIDIGKGFIKYCYLNAAGEEVTGEIPSYYSHGRMDIALPGTANWADQIQFAGQSYIFGRYSSLGERLTIRDDEEKASDINLAFILSVLARLGIKDAEIMVGLPVGNLEKEKMKVKSMFTGVFEASFASRREPMSISIEPWVLSEPLGTYFSKILSPTGDILNNKYYQKKVAIVDIGHSTLDIVLVEQGALSPKRTSGLYGISNIFTKLWRDLEPQYGMIKANEKVDIMRSVATEYNREMIQIGGEVVNPAIWEKITDMKVDLARTIVDNVKSTLSDIRPPITLYTGGGALFLEKEIKAVAGKTAEFHENSRFANAIGFRRMLCYKEKEAEKKRVANTRPADGAPVAAPRA